jgi:universal stress protein E
MKMKPIRNILVVMDPNMHITAGYRRAVALAKLAGAKLHLCLFDYRSAIAAGRWLDEAVMQMAVDEHMTARQNWLEYRAADVSHEGVSSECAAIWGKPLHEAIISKAIEVEADLVIKDVHPEPVYSRVVHTPLDWQLLRLCPAPLMLVNSKSPPLPKRVVTAVDPLEDSTWPHELNDRIVNTGLDVARQCDAPFHAVYAFELMLMTMTASDASPALGYARMLPEIEKIHRESFQKLLKHYQIPEDRGHFLPNPSVDTAIAEFASDAGSDLLVLGTVYHGGLDGLIMGSTAERILYRVTCDVLAVKTEAFSAELKLQHQKMGAQIFDYSKLAA